MANSNGSVAEVSSLSGDADDGGTYHNRSLSTVVMRAPVVPWELSYASGEKYARPSPGSYTKSWYWLGARLVMLKNDVSLLC